MKNDMKDAIRPKLSKAARDRVEELIEAYTEYEFMHERQVATDIRFLLDFHDRVHEAWDGND